MSAYPEPDEALVSRYIAGECTADELSQVESWIAAHPDDGSVVLVLRQRAEQPWVVPVRVDVPSAHRRLWERLGLDRVGDVGLRARAGRSRNGGAVEVGAGALPQRKSTGWILFGVGVTGVLMLCLMFIRAFHPGPRVAVHTYATAAGQWATIPLGDGSEASLGPATTLRITTSASTGTTAAVNGQALFVVTHQHRAPFFVHVGNATARVLGTSFYVRHYTTDHVARVVVVEGRVSLDGMRGVPTRHGAVLSANMLGVVDDSGRVSATSNIAVEDYTGGAAGHLVFRQAAVRDIVAELSRAYGTDIQLADSTLGQRVFTWTLSVKRVTLGGALDALAAALGAHVIKSGSVILIAPGPSASRKSVAPHSPYTFESQYGR